MPDPSTEGMGETAGSPRAAAPPTSGDVGRRSRLDRVLDLVDRLLCVVLVVMMATMLIASVAQVFTRYVLETTLIGPEEIARYMMTGATFLSIPVLARRRNHIAVDALAHYLPSGVTQVVLARGVLLLETVFLCAFTVYAYELYESVRSSGQFSAGLQIPVAWPLSALFIGSLVGALVTAALLVQTFLGSGPPPDDILSETGAMDTGTRDPGGPSAPAGGQR